MSNTIAYIKFAPPFLIPGRLEWIEHKATSEVKASLNQHFKDLKYARNKLYVSLALTAIGAFGFAVANLPSTCAAVTVIGFGLACQSAKRFVAVTLVFFKVYPISQKAEEPKLSLQEQKNQKLVDTDSSEPSTEEDSEKSSLDSENSAEEPVAANSESSLPVPPKPSTEDDKEKRSLDSENSEEGSVAANSESSLPVPAKPSTEDDEAKSSLDSENSEEGSVAANSESSLPVPAKPSTEDDEAKSSLDSEKSAEKPVAANSEVHQPVPTESSVDAREGDQENLIAPPVAREASEEPSEDIIV